jgi:protease-4
MLVENNIINALARHTWLIDENYGNQHLGYVAEILSGRMPLMASSQKESIEYTAPAQYAQANAQPVKIAYSYRTDNYEDNLTELPEGSFAVLQLKGVVTKDFNCGVAGTSYLAGLVQKADTLKNIKGILFVVDSPGGQADGTQSLVDAIKAFSKPSLAFVNDGMCGSAAYWVASACDQIISSHATNIIGSIGTYMTLFDQRRRLDAMGVDLHEIYAPQSTEKNKLVKDAMDGDYKPIQNTFLKPITEAFINSVKENRGERLTSDKPFKGATYLATQALELGLIDQIGNFSTAIKTINTMFGNPLKNVSALASADTITPEILEAANSDLKKEKINNVVLISTAEELAYQQAISELAELKTAQSTYTSEKEALESVTAELEAIKGTNVTLTQQLTEAKNQLTEKETELSDLQTKIKDIPFQLPPSGKKAEDVIQNSAEEKTFTSVSAVLEGKF